MTVGLLIDVRLMLSYDQVARETYDSVGIDGKKLQRAPYFTWVPQLLKSDLQLATELQVARDARLAEKLFTKGKVSEVAGLDLAYAFMDLGFKVHTYSYETPDALEALVARCNLPAKVATYPLIMIPRLEELIPNLLHEHQSLFVLTTGLTPDQGRVISSSSENIVHVDVHPLRSAVVVDELLNKLELDYA